MPVIGPIHKHFVPLGNFEVRKEFTNPKINDYVNEYHYSDDENNK